MLTRCLWFDFVYFQSKNFILWLIVALLLCSTKKGCFHFVNGGGMEQLANILCNDPKPSITVLLLLLGVIEQATRYSVGCEGFLGWWPREDVTILAGTSENYTQLLKLLQKPRHDVASLATYILRRLRIYELTAKYEVWFCLTCLCSISIDMLMLIASIASVQCFLC